MGIICRNKLIVITLIGPINSEPRTLKLPNLKSPFPPEALKLFIYHYKSFSHLLQNPKSQQALAMSERQSFIPNLNEIMEEYVENEEEATPEIQIMAM